MASIEEYRNDINRYYILKDKINSILKDIDIASTSSKKLNLEVGSDFKINGDSAKIVDRIDILDRGLFDIANYLRNAVLPKIDEAIMEANQAVNRLEEAEEARRREIEAARQEEERKRREQEQQQLQAQKDTFVRIGNSIGNGFKRVFKK